MFNGLKYEHILVPQFVLRCSPEFTGKDCDIPKDLKGKLEDMRCVDLVAHLKVTMKEKVGWKTQDCETDTDALTD